MREAARIDGPNLQVKHAPAAATAQTSGMKLLIVAFGKCITLQFEVLFTCCTCRKKVNPDELLIGKAHVYALHCGQMQDVGLVVLKQALEGSS